MSDFHQNGPVTALPRLVARPLEDLEATLVRLTARCPVALVIPMVPWLAIGCLLAEERVQYIAFHDADVVSYSREMLARLVAAADQLPAELAAS